MLAVALIVVSIAVLYSYLKWKQTYWSRRGIEGPPLSFPMGNYYEATNVFKPTLLVLNEWTKKYGKVYGYYKGTVPVLVTSDSQMIQDLFVKKFDNFYARESNTIHGDLENAKEEPRVTLFSSRGARWKRFRALASAAFSVKGLKRVHGIVEDSAVQLIGFMEPHANGGPTNIHTFFQEFTYDIISRISMGQTQCEMFRNPAVEILKKIFMNDLRSLPWYLAVLFPNLQYYVKRIFINHRSLNGGEVGKLVAICSNAVLNRIKQREEMKALGADIPEAEDFIDMFLDAYSEEVVDQSNFAQSQTHVEKKVTTAEIIAQCYIFLLAGFDTTANTLGYAAHFLAKNPLVLKKAQEEIDAHCTEESISYETIGQLKYLEAVLKETVRFYPVAAFASSRECVSTTTLADMKVEKGTIVEADVLAVHKDKNVWGEDAEDFNPERWLSPSSRNSVDFLGFGAGPRLCVGMRLALVEGKLALCHVLRNFNIERGPDTEEELRLMGATTASPERVTVYITKRKE